ncbi:CBS and ACT domain-containing protein [Salipaludibacillus sp. CF4.18]|uniref:CBS and ACT domain-containing protein n=1 Tax=Salipaludibacillus sp. CF4.18 TaxID=3373081 RepID=UPI003EE6C423
MNLHHIMKKEVISADPTMPVYKAIELMDKNRIRHLPIIDENSYLIGIISDRDLRDVKPSIFENNNEKFHNLPVSKVMITDMITAMPDDFVEEAAHTMIENKISCLPVETDGKLEGIISETDLLHTLVRLTGANLPTSRLEVEVPNETGKLAEVSSIISDHQLNIQSALVYQSFETNEKKILVFRIQSLNMRPLLNTLKKKRYEVIWPVDLEMKV